MIDGDLVGAQPRETAATSELYKVFDLIKRDEGHMTLKIQLPMSFLTNPESQLFPGLNPGTDPDGVILAYSRDRRFQCFLHQSQLDGSDVLDVIRDKGMNRSLGFFQAYMNEGKRELIVVLDSFQPDMRWGWVFASSRWDVASLLFISSNFLCSSSFLARI